MAVGWLFLDMNAFFASVEQQINPDLRGRPVAVVPLLADTTCCIAASYEAKAYGIKTGTSVADAKRLCPQIRLVEATHSPYRDFHEHIVSVVQTCLPEPEILSIDEMVCRLWANESKLADAIRLGEHIKTRIKTEVGEYLHCSVGLGLNPFLAKVAAELQKPNGLVVLDEEDLPRKLYGLKLTDFPGIGRRMDARFQAFGVHTTEQMYALSLTQMRTLWGGVVGERWWRLLRGQDVALPPPARRSVGHSKVLPPAWRTPAGATAVTSGLLEKAAQRMRQLGYRAQSLSVYQKEAGPAVWERRIRFSPCADTWTLMEAWEQLWEHPFRTPLQTSIVLSNLVPETDITGELFGDREKRLRASRAVDQVTARYGRHAVMMASSLAARAIVAPDKIAFGNIGRND